VTTERDFGACQSTSAARSINDIPFVSVFARQLPLRGAKASVSRRRDG
jgi:hypothetical protein